jgi:cellulose synthase/poly-beta-1,6-N-acetylglucosamine synthase-like glycosyltransferase
MPNGLGNLLLLSMMLLLPALLHFLLLFFKHFLFTNGNIQLLYGFRVWMAWSKHAGMLRELVILPAFLNSSNIPKCLDQAIQTRKP